MDLTEREVMQSDDMNNEQKAEDSAGLSTEIHRSAPHIVNWIDIILVVLALAMIFTHFWGLGDKPYHHDESIHANNSLHLYQGKGYRYDPVYHGPFLYYSTALVFLLFGVSDFTARLAPTLCGMGIFFLLWLVIRRRIWLDGRFFWIAFLLFISPSMTYFSRFLRMDMFSCFFAVLLLYGVLNYLKTSESRYFIVTCAALSLLYCTKENSHITAFIFCSFPFVYFLWFWLSGKHTFRETCVELLVPNQILFKGIMLFGLAEAGTVGYVLLKQGEFYAKLEDGGARIFAVIAGVIMVFMFAFLFYILEAWLHTLEYRKLQLFHPETYKRNEALLIGIMVFVLIFILFYSNFLNHPERIPDGLFKGLEYWTGQQENPRIPGPFHYYVPLLLLYELPLVLIFLWGTVARLTLVQRIVSAFFLVAGVVLVHDSLLGSPTMKQVKLLSMGVGDIALVLFVFWLGFFVVRRLLSTGKTIEAFVLYWSILAFFLYGIANEKVPWLSTHLVLPLILFAASMLSSAFRDKARFFRHPVLVFVIILASVYSFRSMVQVNFYNASNPNEIMIYVQSHEDVKKVTDFIEDYIFRAGREEEVKIIVEDDNTWPFAWYLRDLSVSYLPAINRVDAPLVITQAHPPSILKKELTDNGFVGRKYHLRNWWIPEWKKLFSKSWKTIFTNLRNYALYRKTFINSVGSSDFMLFYKPVLSDYKPVVVDEPGPSTNTELKTVDKDPVEKPRKKDVVELPEAHKLIPPRLVRIIGEGGSRKTKLTNPKDIEIGPDNKIYVADAGNHRIQIYDKEGNWLQSIGGKKGKKAGQFKDPQGLAVDYDGTIYVADTWNHRIQKFDAHGNFLIMFGQNLNMWGPRDIEIGPDHNLYVSDTGRTMIRVFTRTGKKVREWGFKGSTDGKLSEPVGIAFTGNDEFIVADCGNRRIQIFTQKGDFIRKFDVGGWRNFYSEPYIALDFFDQVFLTDSDTGRILVYNPDGILLKTIGGQGSSPGKLNKPKGIALDSFGQMYVSDSENHRVQVFESPLETEAAEE